MVTQITLGSFGQQNGKNVITGGASQIDTAALIENLVKAKRLPAVRLETSSKTIDTQTEAFNKLKTLFAKFQTAADSLRNVPGVGVASKNIFDYRTVSLTSSTGATATNYVDVAVQPGAAAQAYTVKSITQLALQTKQQTGDILIADSISASAVTANGSPVAGLFQAGTVNLRAVDGTVGGIPLVLNQGDSLETVANKFNELSSRTGIQASVLTVSPGTYRLVYSATKTGETYGFDLETVAPAVGAGVASDPSNVLSQMTFTTKQTAQNAMFNIDDIDIERESNSVADVISGLTFTLKQATVPGTIQVNVKEDTTLVASAITQFADAYNEFRLFASSQQQLDEDSKPKDTSVLYNSNTFRTIINDVSDEITRIVAGVTGSDPASLGDIGLTLENFEGDDTNPETKNILVVDTDKLSSVLLSNFQGARMLFEYHQTSDNSNFTTFKRSNNLTASSFTITIDRTNDVYQATYNDPVSGITTVDLDATAISGGGVSLKGQAGTIFDGSEYLFAAAGDATVSVVITQGFGDRFYNAIDGFTNSTDGTITQELTNLSDAKTRNTDEITNIDERLSRYRDQLIQQYANLESALTRANQILQLLDAQAGARNSASN